VNTVNTRKRTSASRELPISLLSQSQIVVKPKPKPGKTKVIVQLLSTLN